MGFPVVAPEVERSGRVTLATAEARAVVSPARGGLCLSWSVGGRELLYLDQESVADPARNVRGGVPVLFPSPGKLTDGRFQAGGRAGAMGQHGFARNLPWRPVEVAADQVTLELEATDDTLAQFPFRFHLRYRYRLDGAALVIEQRFTSRDDAPLPFACGFHPYFAVAAADKARAGVATPATRAFDNVTGAVVPLPTGSTRAAGSAIDLTAGEVDLHLIDHGGSAAALALPDGARIALGGSPEFSRWVVWTLPGRDFVCLEPWTAPGDALNSGAGLIVLAPGESRDLSLRLELVAR